MKAYKIKIENPCSQDWDKMTESEKGKFCGECSRHLVDFSVMTDAEIIKHIEKSNGNVCGRFNAHQLERDINTPASPTKQPLFYRLMATFLLLFAGIPKDGRTEQGPQAIEIAQDPDDTSYRVDKNGNSKIVATDTTEHVIKGTVFDEETRVFLSKARIELLGFDLVWYSDKAGDFSMVIPDSIIVGDTLVFEVRAAGHEMNYLVVDKRTIPENIRHYVPGRQIIIMGKVGIRH